MGRRKNVTVLPSQGRICPKCGTEIGDEPWCPNCANNRRSTVGARQQNQERVGLPIEIPGSGTFFRAGGQVYKIESSPGKKARRILATETEKREVKEFEEKLRLGSQLRSAVNSARVPGSQIQNVDAFCNKCKRRHALFNANGVENKVFMQHMEQGHLDPVRSDIPKENRSVRVSATSTQQRRQDLNPMKEFHALVQRQREYYEEGLPHRIRMKDSVLEEMIHNRAAQLAGLSDVRLTGWIPGKPCPICGKNHRSRDAAAKAHKEKVAPIGGQRKNITQRMKHAWQRMGGQYVSPSTADRIHAERGISLIPGKQSKESVIDKPPPIPKPIEERIADLERQGVEHLERNDLFYSGTIGPIGPSPTITQRRPNKRERERFGAERNPHLPSVAPKTIEEQHLEVKQPAGVGGFTPGGKCPICNKSHRNWRTYVNAHPRMGWEVKQFLDMEEGARLTPTSGIAIPEHGGGLRMAEHRDVMMGGPTQLNQGAAKTKLCPNCHLIKPTSGFLSEIAKREGKRMKRGAPDICADCQADIGEITAKEHRDFARSIRASMPKPRVIKSPTPPRIPPSRRRQ